MIQTIQIAPPDDWHLHLRDGEALEHVIAATALNFRRAIVMPNLKPPVTTVEQAVAYRDRIHAAIEKVCATGTYSPDQQAVMARFEPLMVLYLTGATSPAEIEKAARSGVVKAVKLYPAGATTNSDAGVSDLLGQCGAVLKAMETCGLPLLVHGEVTDPHVDVFDREAAFVDSVMKPLREQFPNLRVVFEHITTEQAVDFVTNHSGVDAQGRLLLAATITPQHLLYNRNAIFKGGLQPHWYCLPVLKREVHRQALLKAATSGLPQFFLGTDSAPHAKHLKEMSCGCAGCYSAPYAMSMYAEAFEQMGALQDVTLFEKFCSLNGPAFYGLPVNEGVYELQRQAMRVPESLPFVTESGIVPLRAGETLDWTVTRLS
jgi:dihydroorotase